MPYLTEPFRDDARVKAGRKRQAIRFFGDGEGNCRDYDQGAGERFHLFISGLLDRYYAKAGRA
jgi:hypothetical protein